MNRFQATSRCECQATLTAILDEKRHVLGGSASYLGSKESAPAHSINAELDRFDVGWLCPFCGRNTMRTFYAGALRSALAVTAALPAAAPVTMGGAPPNPPLAPKAG
jgi:hypothetical protein